MSKEAFDPMANNLPVKRQASPLALGEMTGELGPGDMQLPRLKIAQGSQDWVSNFKGGSLVLNEERLLAEKGEPILFSILAARKSYEEDLPYDENGPRPRTFATLEEVRAAGLTDAWGPDGQKPPVRPVASFLLAIRKPTGAVDAGFPFEIQGNRYTFAEFTVRSTAYRRFATYVFTKISMDLGGVMTNGVWSMMTEATKVGRFQIIVPKVTLTDERLTPEFLAECKSKTHS